MAILDYRRVVLSLLVTLDAAFGLHRLLLRWLYPEVLSKGHMLVHN